MEWVLRIMANLLRPDELGPAEAAYRAVAGHRPRRARRVDPYPDLSCGVCGVTKRGQTVASCPACGASSTRTTARRPGRVRPLDQEPFTRTSTFVLRRLSVGGSIVYQGHEGRIEANVVPQTHDGRARLACIDLGGDQIFHLETYDRWRRRHRRAARW